MKIEDCFEPLGDGKTLHQGWSPQCEKEASLDETVWGVLKTTSVQDGEFLSIHNKLLPSHLQPKHHLEVQSGDILITCAGPRARCGVACLVRNTRPKLIISGKMYRFRVIESRIDPEYMEIYLRSDRSQKAIDNMKTGSSESGLNLTHSRFRQLPVLLPPLAEQYQIVSKVKELMALCGSLEAARVTRETTRDQMAAASLARLSQPDEKKRSFREHAKFMLTNLAAVSARPDQIGAIRNAVLALAVRGKLVPQDLEQEPASELLNRIVLDRANETGSKTRRASKVDLPQNPFPCPTGWEWAPIQAILESEREISYGVIKLGTQPESGGIPILRCSDVKPGLIDLSNVRTVSEAIESEYLRTRLRGGEILINIRGTLGGVASVPNSLRGYNVAREVAMIPVSSRLSSKFIVYVMLSPYFWGTIQENLRGIAYKGLNLGTLRAFPVPIPPLAEQQKIVDKVDEIISLCDELGTQLTACQTNSCRLMEAVLQEAR